MVSNPKIVVFTQSVRSGKTESSTLSFGSLDRIKREIKSLELQGLKITRINVYDPEIHSAVSRMFPSLKIVFV